MALVAEYDPGEDAYDVLANFMGPFSLHAGDGAGAQGSRQPLAAAHAAGFRRQLRRQAGRVSLYRADGRGGARRGRPVKWIEDRLEHLAASVSATNRVTTLAGGGRCRRARARACLGPARGRRRPYPRAGAGHALPHARQSHRRLRYPPLSVRNRVVLTNKTPTGLNRGFGGPQIYYALERLMQRVAVELGLDPLEVIRQEPDPVRRVSLSHGERRHARFRRLCSGASRRALADGGFAELRARQAEARAQGRLYGIGMTAVVEPSVSNMGYITTVLTPEERRKAGPKNGAQATATVALDPLGGVSVHVASVPQGQGHRTVLAQIVADALGLKPSDIRVITELDTARDAWSIASGNYSSRFAAAVGGAAHLAAMKIKEKLARDWRHRSSMSPPTRSSSPKAACARAAIPTTPSRSPGSPPPATGRPAWCRRKSRRCARPYSGPRRNSTPPSEADEINSSLCHGFIFDFCGVEIDRVTAAVRIDKYVTMHDCGRILHPAMVAGQITGGFAHAVGAALYEEFSYAPDGSFLTGTFADYLLPTTDGSADAGDPAYRDALAIHPARHQGRRRRQLHVTPVCIANAVADALGIAALDLPLTPAKLAVHVHPAERAPARSEAQAPKAAGKGRALHGSGKRKCRRRPRQSGACCSTRRRLAALIPGSHGVEKLSDTHFRAEVTLGVGPVTAATRPTLRCRT